MFDAEGELAATFQGSSLAVSRGPKSGPAKA